MSSVVNFSLAVCFGLAWFLSVFILYIIHHRLIYVYVKVINNNLYTHIFHETYFIQCGVLWHHTKKLLTYVIINKLLKSPNLAIFLNHSVYLINKLVNIHSENTMKQLHDCDTYSIYPSTNMTNKCLKTVQHEYNLKIPGNSHTNPKQLHECNICSIYLSTVL